MEAHTYNTVKLHFASISSLSVLFISVLLLLSHIREQRTRYMM